MKNYGFIKSKIDGTETIADKLYAGKSLDIPSTYSFEKFMGKIIDQGNKPICVPCAISSIIEWNSKVNHKNIQMSLDYIFDQRSDKSLEGMQIKEALQFMKTYGYVTEDDYKKIKDINELKKKGIKIKNYAKVNSDWAAKMSIFMNGPCILGVIVRDNSGKEDFWNGSSIIGGHAVSAVGFDEDGFIIKNSWGYSYGNNGYGIIPYSDFNKCVSEAWTIIS